MKDSILVTMDVRFLYTNIPGHKGIEAGREILNRSLSVLLTKITEKLILNVAHHGCVTMKMFQSRSPKTTLNSIFLSFYLIGKQIYILYQKTFMKKIIVWKNCVKIIQKYYYLDYVEFHIFTEKDNLRFYKNSPNQIFTFI